MFDILNQCYTLFLFVTHFLATRHMFECVLCSGQLVCDSQFFFKLFTKSARV